MGLRKYRIWIFLLSLGIVCTTFVGGYYTFERSVLLQKYSHSTEDLFFAVNKYIEHQDWDIPLSKEFEQELRHIYTYANQKYELNGLIILNLQNKIIYSNHSTDVGKHYVHLSGLMDELDKEKTTVLLRKTGLSEKASHYIDAYYPLKSNESLVGYILFQFKGTPYTNLLLNQTDIIGSVIIIFIFFLVCLLGTQLVGYKRVEERILNTDRTLNRIFDQASDGIVILDAHRNVVMMNKAMENMLGRNIEDLGEAVSCDKLLCCHHDGNETSEATCPARHPDLYHSSFYNFDIRDNENRTLNVSASVNTLVDEKTDETQTILLIRNETNRKREELQLEVLEEFVMMLRSREDLGDMIGFIVNRIKGITGCNEVYIFEGATYESSEIINQPGTARTPYNEEMVSHTFMSKKIQAMQHVHQGKYLATIPLIVNQKINGVLLLIFNQDRKLESQRKQFLYKLATNIAALLKIHNLIKETNEQRIKNEKMYKFALTLQTMATQQKIANTIFSHLQEITGFDFIAYRSEENKISAWDHAIGNIHSREHYSIEGDVINYSLSWGQKVLIQDTSQSNHYQFQNCSMVTEEGLKTLKVIPLIYNHKILGGLLFGHREITPLTEERLHTIRMLINLIALHLENQQLYTRIENDATILERQRISREIHDGLAQNIGFVNIQLHRLSKMLEKNQVIRAISEIDVIKQAVDDSYVELRETIDQLRDIGIYKESLSSWLVKYLDDFEKTHNIKVEIEMKQMDKVKLSDNQLVQITRVLQEILNNIRKHSKATKVKLYGSGGKVISLLVEDNGVGFDITALKKSKYSGNGLPILEERMRSINGNIHINSRPNEGTKIEIQVPMVG